MARTTIPAELVAINAIQGTLIADNAITAVHIATNAVSGTLVADNAITSTHIAQNNVTATQIAQNTITVTQMADSAIETAKINNDAVTQAKIADDAVGADQLAANAVVSASIANGTIVAADLADNAVTLAKMASLARGKIIYGDSAGDPAALAVGSNGQVLTTDGTDISWGAVSGGGGVDGISSSADATAITIDSSERVMIGSTTSAISANAQKLQIANAGATSVYHSSVMLHSQQNDGNANVTRISWSGGDGASTGRVFSSIEGGKENSTSGEYGGMISMSTRPHGGTQTERMRITSTGNVGIGTTSPSSLLSIKNNGSGGTWPLRIFNSQDSDMLVGFYESSSGDGYNGMLYMNDGAGNTDVKLSTNGPSWFNGGSVGINETSPDFTGFGSDGGGLELDDVGQNFTAVKVSHGATGEVYLAANTGAAYLWGKANSPTVIGTNNAERIRISETGQMFIGKTGINQTTTTGHTFQTSGTVYRTDFNVANNEFMIFNNHSSPAGTASLSFRYNNSQKGSIGLTSSAVSFNTSSDYRLKENVDYDWNATTRLKQLKPARFNWISDDTNTLVDGFIAHEVTSIVPNAVEGTKDEVYDDDHELAGEPKYQQVDHSKLVPLLVKTIQELEARVKTLEG